MEITNCPNCNTELKGGFFAAINTSTPETVLLINTFGTGGAKGYCSKCEGAFVKAAVPKYLKEYEVIKANISRLIEEMPIITIPSPKEWDYEAVSIVTGQSVTGTGVISEFTSSFTDFLGKQSGAYNKKLVEGEKLCMNIMRKKAFDLGCNAIIGTDVDYSEAGSLKGMLMVCMAGTAIKLKNPEKCGANHERLKELMSNSEWWQKYGNIYYKD